MVPTSPLPIDNNKSLNTQELNKAEIRKRIEVLQAQLKEVTLSSKEEPSENDQTQRTLEISKNAREGEEDATGDGHDVGPPYKCGYLSKWNDRAIGGFAGTRAWDKRFVVLNRGRLAYYKTHTDSSPRYVLSLQQCAVRDDGSKPVKALKLDASRGGISNEPVQGRFYYVFSIYQRPHANDENIIGLAATDDENIVPVLRFSTQSLAEKNQWIDRISQACIYSELHADSDDDSQNDNGDDWAALRTPAAHALPKAKPGTLAPIYFGLPAPSKKVPRSPFGVDVRSAFKRIRRVDNASSNPRSISGYPPSRPMHRSSKPSYLSAEGEVQNYRGLLNLALIILAVSNVRIVLDTIRKHGNVLLNPPDLSHFIEAPLADFPFLSGLVLLHVFIVLSYVTELALSRGLIGNSMGLGVHFIVSNLSLIVPVLIVWHLIDRPVQGLLLIMQSMVTWMKLISYAHANSDYRLRDPHQSMAALVRDLDETEAQLFYPKNVTLANLYNFWLFPTLTYQLAFPRKQRIRWAKVAGIIIRLVGSLAFLVFLVVQVIAPNLDNLVRDLDDKGGVTFQLIGDYLLKLSIANTYIWLLIFYIFFHLFLNLCAEVSRFGDRVFYKDWWNASEVSSYWRLWNMPVHYWLVRHVYFPCIRSGMSRTMATVTVFFVSAVMHELLLSVPFHFVRAWSFIGMMAQIPLSSATKYLERKLPGSSVGNIIFWLTFCVVGQPMAVLLYTIDYWSVIRGRSASAMNSECRGTACEL